MIINSQSIIDTLKIKKLSPKKANVIINKELVKTELNSKSRAILIAYKADLLKDQGNIYTALELYKQSYKLVDNTNYLMLKIQLLNKISDINILLYNYSEAIDDLTKIEKLIDKINVTKKFNSSSYVVNMAQMFFKIGEFEKSKKYYHQSFKIAKNNKDSLKLNKHYLDLSALFIKTKHLDSAVFYSSKVLNFSKSIKNYKLQSQAHLIMGNIYENKDDFILAEKQYKKAIEILNSIGSNTASVYKKMGNFYKRVYLYDFADESLKTAVGEFTKSSNIIELQELYHNLLENSILQKRPFKANIYLKKYDSLTRILNNESHAKNRAYINERYNIQQAEIKYLNDRNTLLKKQRELIIQKKIAKKNKWIYFIIIMLLMVSFLGAYLYYRYKKVNIEKTNIQLKNTVLRLQMNPHFIFNSLTAIQNSILKNDQLKSAELIAVFSKLIRQNLEFSNKKHISLKDEIDMLTNYLKTQKFRFNNLFDFSINIDDKIDIETVKIPPMLLQPFIENSIEHGLKHRESDGLVIINIKKISKGISICIEDNGVGREVAKLNNKNDDDENKIHAIKIFKERLKNRQKKEMQGFVISDVLDDCNNIRGTKIEFNLLD